MVLELAFLLVPKGPSHLTDSIWAHVASFLAPRDAARLAQCSTRLRGAVALARSNALTRKHAQTAAAVAEVAAAPVSAASSSNSHASGAAGTLVAAPKPETTSNEDPPEQPETSKGLFASLRAGGFSLRKPKKK